MLKTFFEERHKHLSNFSIFFAKLIYVVSNFLLNFCLNMQITELCGVITQCIFLCISTSKVLSWIQESQVNHTQHSRRSSTTFHKRRALSYLKFSIWWYAMYLLSLFSYSFALQHCSSMRSDCDTRTKLY